jgi:hypothetical protein
MATITIIAAFVLLMSTTILVMRWVFRSELREAVDETFFLLTDRTNQLQSRLLELVGDWQPIENIILSIVKPIVEVNVPKVGYSTSNNVLTIVNDEGEFIEFNMFNQSKEALDIVEALVKEAEMQQDKAEAILDDLYNNDTVKKTVISSSYRGDEWGVKSKLRK